FTSYMCFFLCSPSLSFYSLVFFSLAAPPVIYTLSLHDALPIYGLPENGAPPLGGRTADVAQVDLVVFPAELPMLPNERVQPLEGDRKSTRLNSSHVKISYAVFCLKKKKKN